MKIELNSLDLWLMGSLATMLVLSYRSCYPLWQRWRWEQRLHLKKHAALFYQLFRDVDGFSLSKQARQQRDAIAYTYGEIEFHSFIALLSCVPLNQQTIFWDLGSGVGKAVIACALVFPVRASVGIELFANLADCALAQKERLRGLLGSSEVAERIRFIQGDFFTADLSTATVIFINATTIINPAWDDLGKRLADLSALEILITTTKPCSSPHFTVIRTTMVAMSWGVVNAYIHQRLQDH